MGKKTKPKVGRPKRSYVSRSAKTTKPTCRECLSLLASIIIALASALNFCFGYGRCLWTEVEDARPTVLVVRR